VVAGAKSPQRDVDAWSVVVWWAQLSDRHHSAFASLGCCSAPASSVSGIPLGSAAHKRVLAAAGSFWQELAKSQHGAVAQQLKPVSRRASGEWFISMNVHVQ
jgi:hypothetical protein